MRQNWPRPWPWSALEAQSEFQTLAMKSICGITAVRPYNIDPTATGKVAFNLAHLGLTVIPCDSA
ncbi:MAG: hypothetical protein P8M25_03235 [Paracoccaceae bacterium]|nr:hypothetical protein [Paracoccaceae bacterium]